MLEPLDKGVVTARDSSRLNPGELVKAEGGVYYPGDQRLWKQNGRSEAGDTGTAVKVDGVALAVFDDAPDQLVALSGGNLHLAPVSTGVFESRDAATGSILSAAHSIDRWYLSTGGEENYVLEADGTIRLMSMRAPTQDLTYTAVDSAGTADVSATSTNDAFDNSENAWDGNESTFATKTLSTGLSSETVVFELTFENGDNTGTGRQLEVSWSYRNNGFVNTGSIKMGFKTFDGVNVQFENRGFYDIPDGRYISSYSVPDGEQLDGGILTITFQKLAGLQFAPTMKVNTTTVTDGGDSGTFVLAGAHSYAITEYDEDRGLESIRGDLVTFDPGSTPLIYLNLFLPTTKVNSTATHLRIYKTPLDGTVTQLALQAEVPFGTTKWIDQFPTNIQDAFLYEHIFIGDLAFDRDYPAEAFWRIRHYDGRLIGFPVSNTRAARYSEPGRPESFPVPNEITKFNLEENDQLLDGIEVGGSFMFFAEAAVFRLDRFPQVIGSQVLDSPVVRLAGAPGATGRYAVAEVEFQGKQQAAWISYDGVYATTGHTYVRISDNIDWRPFEALDKSGWVLHFDQNRRLLVMSYCTTTGENNKYALIHLHPTHVVSGQPKWTSATPGSISSLTSGLVSGRRRLYSGHTTDGKVYLEDDSDTGLDASNAIDGNGTHRLDVQRRRLRGARVEYEIHDGFVKHSDFGVDQDMTTTHTVGRDSSKHESVKTNTVSLEGDYDTQFDVGRAGNWSDMRLVHTGTGIGALSDIFETVMVGEKAGG